LTIQHFSTVCFKIDQQCWYRILTISIIIILENNVYCEWACEQCQSSPFLCVCYQLHANNNKDNNNDNNIYNYYCTRTVPVVAVSLLFRRFCFRKVIIFHSITLMKQNLQKQLKPVLVCPVSITSRTKLYECVCTKVFTIYFTFG